MIRGSSRFIVPGRNATKHQPNLEGKNMRVFSIQLAHKLDFPNGLPLRVLQELFVKIPCIQYATYNNTMMATEQRFRQEQSIRNPWHLNPVTL